MAEASVFNLADSIIGKSSSLTFPETEPWLNLRDYVDDLRSIVSAIKAKLLDAGERSGTSNFTAWLKKLKDALCDASFLLEELSMAFLLEELLIGCLFSLFLAKMCAQIQAVNKRLTSLESELKILFMAGTRQQWHFEIIFMAGTRQQGHFFVHKDEEQSVKDSSFQGRLKVQKDLENMPVDSISPLSQAACSLWRDMVKKRVETSPFEKMHYDTAEFGRLCRKRNWLSFMSNESKKSNRKFVSDDLLRQERKRTKKQWQLPYPEESLTSQPQRKSKRKECALNFFIKGGSAQEIDRTKRKTNKIGELIYWERKLESMEMRRKKTIKKQWLQSDPLAIKQEIQEIDRKYKDAVLAEDEAKWRLLLVGEKIEELDQQQSEFYFAPRWSEKVTATDYRPIMLTGEEVLSKLRDLENQLHDEDNNKVEYKDFLGLEQALKKTAWGKTPDYLQTIAIRIEKARGKATDVFHIPAQVPVCAAIKEMEDFPVEDLDWDTLKKWGATLNYAKKYGFQVGFADNLLKKNLLAYLVIQNLPKSTAKN
ncbi:hypothetical protein ERO13_D11G339900v2 [Gossypium hirsutum]|uniref:Disease resistance N-terminal domain-containing protein n=1 Tax=Gossypium hirsutum TaxID=3635 RepID=A0A1U8MUX7_GOSHI|nr:uncharacterized protein LOC107940451 [Gossypium hirsutum]KAG4123660.1 hypothetical protein ERO13_D11G339900v2 [Gossypium hirsutum]